MLNNIIYYNKILVFCSVFFILILLMTMCFFEEGFAQNMSPKDTEKMKSIQIINPNPIFSLRLLLDKGRGESFNPGEKITIRFKSTRDAFVTLYNYDTAGRVKIIFPNRYSPHNFVKAGQEYKVEGQIAPDTQAGTEFVQGFATTRPLLVSENIKNMIAKQLMPQISSDYRSFIQRMKSIIRPLPPTEWVSSNLLSFNIISPPPPVNHGNILINSNPSGAKVYLNDVYRGISPLSLNSLDVGYYQVKMVKSGYEDWSKKVYVYSSKTTNVSATLVPLLQSGSIAISCNQSNAKIYLDGDYKKRTSSSKTVMLEDINAGYHELSITKTGYTDWSEKIYVTPNQVINVYVNLTKPLTDGSIAISCNQGNAKIYLDEKYQKRTLANKSVELKNIEQGYHELLITKEGYQDWTITIMVTANQTNMISAFLAPEVSNDGSVAVYCNIDNAKIFINGTYKVLSSSSQSKVLEKLKERMYEITVIKDGYRTWVEEVWVYAGETVSMYIDLKEIEF